MNRARTPNMGELPPSYTEAATAFSGTITRERICAAQILIIDEHEASLERTLSILRGNGFHQLHSASDAESGMLKLAQTSPDLIIVDRLTDQAEGAMLCSFLRSRENLKDVPILAYTAVQDESLRLNFLTMGACDLATKPLPAAELATRCGIHIEKRFILKDLQDYRSRMEADLNHARELQNLLMPNQQFIERTEQDFSLQISSLFAPSVTIGGDFWGIHPLPASGRMAIYIGDFTGHGITAAINVFRLCTLMGRLPEETLASASGCMLEMNQQLHSILPVELFATMFYGVLDTENDTLTYCIAGSQPPLLLSGAKPHSHHLLAGSGLPLAATASPHYREHTIPFRQGDTLMLYSDALIETPNTQGDCLSIQQFGDELSDMVARNQNTEQMLEAVTQRFDRFTNGAPVRDDLTLNFYRRI